MKKIIIALLVLSTVCPVWTTQDRVVNAQPHGCMVCGNIDRLLSVGAAQACHRYLCVLCYSDHWEMPTLRDVQTGKIYWNFECSHCAQTVRFYSTVEYNRYFPDNESDDDQEL